MNRPPIIFGTTRTLDDVPRAHGTDLWAWAVVLVVTFLAVALAPTPARAETLTETEVAQIAVKFFPAREVPRVIRVAQCESGLDTNAVSAGWDAFWGHYDYQGLMQISAHIWQSDADRIMGYQSDLRDPVVNIATAAFIWSSGGWAHWPYCGFR